jgi:uncharacterized protein (DUF58 family)
MKKVLTNIFFTSRLAYALVGMCLLFIVSFWIPALFIVSRLIFTIFLGYCAFELYNLFQNTHGIVGRRSAPTKLSNGDQNDISIEIENRYDLNISTIIIDELPVQFQYRDSYWNLEIPARERRKFTYFVKPLKRGNYHFGALVILVSLHLQFFRRRYKFDQGLVALVYPSFVHLRKYELTAFGNVRRAGQVFVNKKLGHGMEFEQIKEYVQGDPQRWLNWKATAKRQSLMVNQYTDELSKDIWCFVDKGRLMKMPFDGLSLLDYAINATLATCHIAIRAGDNAGLLSFSNKLSSIIMPSKRSSQMPLIMEALYSQRTRYMESDYELMTKYIKSKIRRRSLILLFTNFETLPSFRRQLTTIKRLVRSHVVVVFFFENTEITDVMKAPATSLKGIYTKAIAEEVTEQKQIMIQELKSAGIFAVMVKPQELSLKSINKYLEIKTRGLL